MVPTSASRRLRPRVDAGAADARQQQIAWEGWDPISDVTRAVLAFHVSEGNGNGASRAVERADGTTYFPRGGERTVPLESWARRYKWDVPFAERVLWDADCPTRGRIVAGGVEPDPAVKTVDAAVAYVGVWITFVEADHVVSALAECKGVDGTRKAHVTKREALEAAQEALLNNYGSCVPEGGTNIQARTTAGAFGDVLKCLRRRYKTAAECPFVILTRKAKRQRVYRCVPAGTPGGGAPPGWEVVFGSFKGTAAGGTPGGGVEDARQERGGFGVRAGIGRGGLRTTPVGDATAMETRYTAAMETPGGKAGGGGADPFESAAAAMKARRAARSASWKLGTAVVDARGGDAKADDGEGAVASRQLVAAANRRRRARLSSW